MKNFVLAILLLFYYGQSFAQKVAPRELVRKSFLKLTGGKKHNSFGLTIQYGKPGKIPTELLQQDPLRALMDSLMKVVPDSVKTKMAEGKRQANANLYDELYQKRLGATELIFADFLQRKTVHIRMRPNAMKGAVDTSRYVQDLDAEGLISALKFSPVSMLQYMLADTAELHYTGTTSLRDQMHHVVQVRLGKKWVDVLIGANDLLPARAVFPRIDEDPLIGVGPERFKEIHDYSRFSKVGGFLLPATDEEIETRSEFTTVRHLKWSALDNHLPDSLFAPDPPFGTNVRLEITEIGQRLFVMRMTGGTSNLRTLIRVTDQGMDVFSNFAYNQLISSKMRRALADRFPGLAIRRLFTPESIASLHRISNFFDAGTVLHFPKGRSYLSVERLRKHSPQEDSTWQVRLNNHTIDPFENDFELDGYQVSILNAEETSDYSMPVACYYLPEEKVVYAKGLFYYENNRLIEASKWEKFLWGKINARKWQVDKVIFNESMVDDIPLQMSYQDFERRVRTQ